MILTHLLFFMRKLAEPPPPSGFRGYTTAPPVLAFMRRLSTSGVTPGGEQRIIWRGDFGSFMHRSSD